MPELLLLSGGIDSAAIAAWRRPACCLTIDYGQRPATAEVDAAKEICRALRLTHEVGQVPIQEFGTGMLAGKPMSAFSPHEEFWPFRNQFLITLAAMYALSRSLTTVLIGTVRNDGRHADGSVRFVRQISELVAYQEGQVSVVAPAIELTSVDLVRVSGITSSVLGWTHSCHNSEVACGNCPGCRKHAETMEALSDDRSQLDR